MKMFIKYFIVVFTAMLLGFNSCDQSQNASKKTTKTRKVVTVSQFNADSAYAFVAKQVSFGPRVPGTEAHQHCANWIAAKMNEFADTVYLQRFKARTYDKVTRNGVNIIASFKPKENKRLLLMAHWDSRPFADHDDDEANFKTPIDGANDGASGVGVLLEIARQFSLQSPNVGVDIVLFDLEDWGPPTQLNLYDDNYWGLGSQHWSKSPHIYGYQAAYGILLDMVGAEDAVFRKEYHSKLYARYILDMVWQTAGDIGYDEYFIDEDGIAATDDHYFVNKYAKIPSIDIIHVEDGKSGNSFFEHWHTTGDNMDKIDRKTLNMVGQVVMTVVYWE